MTVAPRLFVPDWYGRLDVTAARPSDAPTPADGLWLILYEDWFDPARLATDRTLVAETQALRAEVLQKFPDALAFDFLPMIFVHAAQADLEGLAQLPRFRYALPQSVAVADYLPILRGIEALRSETGHQLYEWQALVNSGVTLPDEKFVGGLMPAGPYPAPRDHRLITADPALHRTVAPAWMPVLNFSIGPMLPEGPANPVLLALAAAANTHLVVIAAGNSGLPTDQATLNQWAPPGGTLMVGASEDEQGSRLADYSSRGAAIGQGAHPDVVACGLSKLGDARGTSFAAPRVAKAGCLAAAALFQVARVWEEFHGRATGVPLMGWGMVDTGGDQAALPARDGSVALPFAGVDEQLLHDTFHHTAKAGATYTFNLNGAWLRTMLLGSARPMPGYGRHEVGAGFVSEGGLIDWLARQSVESFLQPFGPTAAIPATLRAKRLFDRAALGELADALRRARPTWFFDYQRQQFGVNRTPAEGELTLPLPGRGYAHAIHVAVS